MDFGIEANSRLEMGSANTTKECTYIPLIGNLRVQLYRIENRSSAQEDQEIGCFSAATSSMLLRLSSLDLEQKNFILFFPNKFYCSVRPYV